MKKAIVYPAAGLSSRFGGKIKQFVKVGPNGESLSEYSMNQALKAGFDKIIFIVGEKTEKGFKEMFGNEYKGVPVLYAYQGFDPEERDKPWGTTDALCCAKDLIDCPFVFCNGDDIYGETAFKILAEHLEKSEEDATIGYRLYDVVPEKGSVNRGIFEADEDRVKKITETFNIVKDDFAASGTRPDDLASQNIFALHLETLNLLDEIVKEKKKLYEGDRKKEILLPEDLSTLIESGKIKMKVYKTPDRWLGVTNPGDEDGVREELKRLEDEKEDGEFNIS